MRPRILELRRGAKISQIELAAAIEVSRQTVMSLEQGDSFPHLLTAYKLAGALKCRVEDLYDRDEVAVSSLAADEPEVPIGP
jgi:putative transcriptional regulator